MTASRYLDSFVRSPAGGRLAALRVFPNAKEVTESYAARAATLRLRNAFPPDDRSISCVVVGDGSTPRTAATFALHSGWQCHSVDPQLREPGRHWLELPRLTIHRARIEECSFTARKVVVAAIHCHVGLSTSLRSIVADDILLIAMPCCVPVDLDAPPLISYDDPEVLSPKRTIHIWHLTRPDG